MTCHECQTRVPTYQQSESTLYTVLLSAVVFAIFQIWSLFLLPIFIPLTRSITTRCIKCDEALHTMPPYGVEILKDEIITLSCGKCAVVLSRKYLLALFTVLSCGLIMFWVISEPGINKPKVYINNTWPEFVRNCGTEVLMRNSVTATTNFENIYEDRTVSWEGYLMK